jgi:hypothetical protein
MPGSDPDLASPDPNSERNALICIRTLWVPIQITSLQVLQNYTCSCNLVHLHTVLIFHGEQ